MSLRLVPFLADDLDFLPGRANGGTKVFQEVLSLSENDVSKSKESSVSSTPQGELNSPEFILAFNEPFRSGCHRHKFNIRSVHLSPGKVNSLRISY